MVNVPRGFGSQGRSKSRSPEQTFILLTTGPIDMNIFWYDLLRKVKGVGGWIAAIAGLLLLLGLYISEKETALDLFAARLSGEPTSAEVMGLGIVLAVIGLAWSPICKICMTSLEKTFSAEDRRRLGLAPESNIQPASISVPVSVPIDIAKVNDISDAGSVNVPAPSEDKKGTSWLPVSSMVMGILTVLTVMAFIDESSQIDASVVPGGVLISVVGLVLGIVALFKQKKGRKMAIAGVVMNALAVLALLGSLSETSTP